METLNPQQLALFEADPELQEIVDSLEEVIQKDEYCPFVVTAITKYILPGGGAKR